MKSSWLIVILFKFIAIQDSREKDSSLLLTEEERAQIPYLNASKSLRLSENIFPNPLDFRTKSHGFCRKAEKLS